MIGISGSRLLRRLSWLVPVVALATAAPALGLADHTGWPSIGHHKGHPNNESGTMRGWMGVHNELLGGDSSDTIWAGNEGDVIWGDSHEGNQPTSQVDRLHGGSGEDWLYSSHGYNHIWTGAGNDHIALVYGHGIIDCDGPGRKTLVMRYLPQNRPWKLVGCTNKLIVRYRA
jgi:Ca2+-binding RTX toxin-like protein